MTPALFLFDDETARSWEPFALTRPVGELMFGAFTLRERAERFWTLPCRGHLSSPTLQGFSEHDAPPVADLGEVGDQEHRLFMSSRVVARGASTPLPQQAANLRVEGQVVGWSLPPGFPTPPRSFFLAPEPLPAMENVELEGWVPTALWDLMGGNSRQLQEDIPIFFPGYAADDIPGCHVLGQGLLSLGSGVELEPGSVFDVRGGPIRLSDGVTVASPSRLEGPLFVGPETTILGGSVSGSSLGPVCKIRGEVESSVVLGYSNKAHDGFLGHAYLGRWVNLGALTTNSDLKNNYGPVRVGSAGGPRETGLLKVGCFLGDHVKTGIGTLLNTGTVVGAGSNLFGGGMPPTWIPPFSWGSGPDLGEYRLDAFLEVADRVMDRRGVELKDPARELLTRVWEATRPLRAGSDSGSA